jgi:kinetochore protein Mis13/DSN1
MTTLVARQPLQTLSMSSSQRGPRRLSARLQEKEDAHSHTNGYHLPPHGETPGPTDNGISKRRTHDKPPASKKRRIGKFAHTRRESMLDGHEADGKSTEYDEEDDGFMFTRAKARKARPSNSNVTSIREQSVVEKENSRPPEVAKVLLNNGQSEPKEPPKKGKNRLSFSTPNVRTEKPVRRSKRLSDEAERRDGSPPRKAPRKDQVPAEDSRRQQEVKRPPEEQKTPRPPPVDMNEEHSATKIALPFADTPVIRKNKAMREGKGEKGDRRSSLGLRGRRASSLIDSGNSNGEYTERWRLDLEQALMKTLALPHSEVEVADFYKHIESGGLTEPRRMRQLLTWCATRAIGEQPEGQAGSHPGYDDHSAHLAGKQRSAFLRSVYSDYRSSARDTGGAAPRLCKSIRNVRLV